MNYSLVKAVLNDTWSVSLQYYLQYNRIANAILSGIHFEMEKDSIEPFFQLFDIQSSNYINSDGKSSSNKGLIAVHSVEGIMLKYDTSSGKVGTRTIGQSILNIDKNPDIIAHVVIFDTGGGQSNSVAPLQEAFQKATKPIVSFIDGHMHSAGVFAGVSADEIVARPGSFMGSIGTFIEIEGIPQNHTDKDGKVYRRIYATTSGKKNLEYEEALKGNDAPVQKNLLDPHDKLFMDAVKANRPNITDEQLEGGFFQVENLVGTLVDSIGDLDFAISRAVELANKNKNSNSNQISNSNTMSKPKFNLLTKAVNSEKPLEVNDGGIFLSTEQATSVETLLGTNANTIEAYSGLKDSESIKGLRDQITALTSEKETLTSEKETLSNDNATLKTENDKLSKKTVTPTGAGADNDGSDAVVVDAEAEHFFNLSQIK